jgi:hypothetical protein
VVRSVHNGLVLGVSLHQSSGAAVTLAPMYAIKTVSACPSDVMCVQGDRIVVTTRL